MDEDINNSQVMEQIEKPQQPHKREIGKEMEAKVAYQYPKGNFRFPIIPDGKRAVRRVEKSPPNRPEPVVTKQKSPEPPPPSIKPSMPKSNAQQPKKGSPFRPTEIPSPVFGFNQHKKIDVVEHELSDFGTYAVDNESIQSTIDQGGFPNGKSHRTHRSNGNGGNH
ncbi:hypothetical protein RCG23_17400 [Neobacillus sp. PS3-34]|uniref:hypothetical protein n=1 Tax=Neobacillus sp. PS3-34 TaxID=3070678 RepID=UPI0027E0F75B|nr:hypothetical protein [Neobacillus sp. PS3-34]WML47270.1 hypothetical protein RCG23_17400 [Neobacillus sp. PS3-34]